MSPSRSPRQARTMRAAAHDPEFARKLGIPQSVAREYVEADKRASKKRKRSKRSKRPTRRSR